MMTFMGAIHRRKPLLEMKGGCVNALKRGIAARPGAVSVDDPRLLR